MRRILLLAFAAACTHPATVTRPTVPIAKPTPKRIEPATLGARVLLAVTGYSAPRDAIALAELTRDYCAGTIAVLAPVQAIADQRFACTNPRPIATLDAFLPNAKTAAIVTDLDHVSARWKALRVDDKSAFANPATYPLVVGTFSAEHLTHFILTGVTAITRAAGAQIDANGIDWYTKNLRAEFADAKYVHISNEVSIKSDCTYPVSGTYQFCSKERDFQALIDLHANVIELTGNHMRDFGDEPLKKTLVWYKAHHMGTFGGGNNPAEADTPLVLELADGKKLGILGYNERCPLHECSKKPGEIGANAWDPAKAKAGIAKLREAGVDFIMTTVQFKEWDSAQPMDTQQKISRDLIDMGSDLVYGSQAHQLQLVEFYNGKPIFYGLGNLMFDQIHRLGVRQAFFLHEYFFDGKLVQAVPVFTFMSDDRQPTLATPEQAAAEKAIIFEDARLYSP